MRERRPHPLKSARRGAGDARHACDARDVRDARQFDQYISRAARVALACALAFGAGAACGRAPEGGSDAVATARPAPSPPKPATPAEAALLSPLAKGSALGGWEVQRVEGIDRGALKIVCVKGRAGIHLYVALASDDGPAPPATAGRYAIFYSLKDAAPEDGERLAKEVAAVVEKNTEVPPPEGMTPFVPRPAEPISL
jgi:hypothetical protein